MSRTLHIIRDGRVESTLELENGSYIIGRDPASDIVLADPAVSKNHATLVFDGEQVIIKDNNSANGVFLNDKKISEHAYSGDFEFEIKPFIIRSAGADVAAAGPAEEKKPGWPSVKLTNIKLGVFALVAVVMLGTLLIGYLPLKQEIAAFHRREVLKNGIVLSRYLAEMNRPALMEEQLGRARISPVEKEEGVIYAFVVDAHGRIIAPPEKRGDFFNWKGLTPALEGDGLVIDDGPRDEKIIFYPIIRGGRTFGAAIIGFAHSHVAGKTVPGFGVGVYLFLMILFGLGIAVAYLLVRAFLAPLRQLHEEMEIAIKEGDGRLNFDAPYPEIDNIKRTFERLLMRKVPPSGARTPSLRKPEEKMPPIKAMAHDPIPRDEDVPLPSSDPKPSMSARLKGLKTPWCIIDRENYTLSGSSDDFAGAFGLAGCKNGMHVIEAFDTDMVQMVSQLMDAPADEEITLDHPDGNHLLRRIYDPAEPTHMALILEDKT
jgi:hypothetical protein